MPLQRVDYKKVGVILSITPVVRAGNKVDIDVVQEVSSAVATSTGVNNTATINKTIVDTKLSLTDGSTILMAGYIRDDVSKTETGIPVALL